jgi:hypothetical protein
MLVLLLTMPGMNSYFGHEKLNAYQLSIASNLRIGEFLATVNAKAAAKDQLDLRRN